MVLQTTTTIVRLTLALCSLVSVCGYQLPRTSPRDHAGLGLSRREAAVVIIGGVAWSSSSLGGGSNRAVAATPGFKAAQGYSSNGDTVFRLEVCARVLILTLQLSIDLWLTQ
jgi:hypothetical protein